MSSVNKLTVLWTTDDLVTCLDMVFMYAANAKKFGWFEEVTLVIWGPSAVLAAENPVVQQHLKEMAELGVTLSACKACADRHEVSKQLEALGIEVKYWGVGLTEVLKGYGKLLTV
jgi:hypothetical protein